MELIDPVQIEQTTYLRSNSKERHGCGLSGRSNLGGGGYYSENSLTDFGIEVGCVASRSKGLIGRGKLEIQLCARLVDFINSVRYDLR